LSAVSQAGIVNLMFKVDNLLSINLSQMERRWEGIEKKKNLSGRLSLVGQ